VSWLKDPFYLFFLVSRPPRRSGRPFFACPTVYGKLRAKTEKEHYKKTYLTEYEQDIDFSLETADAPVFLEGRLCLIQKETVLLPFETAPQYPLSSSPSAVFALSPASLFCLALFSVLAILIYVHC